MFPNILATSAIPTGGKFTLNTAFEVSPTLLSNTTFHREFLERSGLSKPLQFYEDKEYQAATHLLGDDSHIKVMGVEFFGMLRSGMDLRMEYDNMEELKRLRETYIYHVLDYVL